jgi:hypothetical protein
MLTLSLHRSPCSCPAHVYRGVDAN